MATTTSIMWTALPNGGAPRAYHLSIYVSPRLEGSGATGMLADYNLGNWAAHVRALALVPGAIRLQLGSASGPVVPVAVPPAYVAALEPALWHQVFPPATTEVTPRVFQDQSKRWIRSYNIRATEAYIQDLYNGLAEASPAAFPDLKSTTPVTQLTDVVSAGLVEIRRLGGLPGPRQPKEPKTYNPVPQSDPASGQLARATHPDRGIEQQLATVAANLGAANVPLAELYRAYRFFRRGNDLPYDHTPKTLAEWDATKVSDPLPKPTVDFHQVMAALGDAPYLLRRLGLIIDVIVPLPQPLLAAFNQVQVVVPPRPGMSDITPFTAYELNAAVGFRARPRPVSDLGSGMLRLDNTNVFDVIQTDPDGNALKVFDYAVSMAKVRSTLLAQKDKNPVAKSSMAPEPTSVPALRSGGLAVTRSGRDDTVWDNLSSQSGHELSPETSLLFADDLTRGFRYDVQYKGQWCSLQRRSGVYTVAGRTFAQPEPDEGYVKAVSASSDPPDPTLPPPPPTAQKPDLYVHEMLVGWHNWSLAARQPGKTIVATPTADKHQTESVEHKGNDAATSFDIGQEWKPESASLPPLRFGETYRVRARAVDLAGNSLGPPPSPKFPMAVDEAPAGFAQSPPITYLRYDPVPAPALVPKTPNTPGESVQTIPIRHRSTQTPMPFPAEAMIDLALFNDTADRWVAAPKSTVAFGEAHGRFDTLFKNPGAAFAMLSKESGSFDDFVVGQTKLVDASGATAPYPPPSPPLPLPPWKPGDPFPNGQYMIHTETPVLLPYLPDPLAHGVVFMPLSPSGVATGDIFFRPFDETGGWPQSQPFQLQLGETSGAAPVFSLGGGNTLASIQLPRGTQLSVRVASAIVDPTSPDPGELTVMGRWRGMTDAGRAQTAAHGFQNWMITPFRVVTFVNAVEKPMPAATTDGTPTFDTDPKRILALLKGPGATFVTLENGSVVVNAPSTGEIAIRGRWDEFVDDPLDPTGPKRPVTPSKDVHVADIKVDYEENVVPIGGGLAGVALLPGPKHELGDTKHRFVWYRAVATTRYREFFPPNLTGYEAPMTKEKLITVTGPEVRKNVLNSARPAPPEILYLVPTFKWIDTASGRVRQGRGLRIYFKRGWFSSGEGELLGVVLAPDGDMSEDLRSYISLWGSDPIFDKNGPTAPLGPTAFLADGDFPEASPVLPVGVGLPLAEAPFDVRVQGYAPQYDDDRKLWFVDVNFDLPNAYYTFVRLALCRYQPDSLAGSEISKVVRVEFSQLLPDRTASVDVGAQTTAVSVSGPFALSHLGHAWNGDVTIAPLPINTVGSATSALSAVTPPDAVTPPIIVPPALVSNPQAGSAHSVSATIEWRPQGSTSDLAWQTLDGISLAPYTTLIPSGFVTWQGTLRWPRAGLPGGREYRLVLRELEIYETDLDVAESLGVANANGANVRSRLVYVDVYPLAAPPAGTSP